MRSHTEFPDPLEAALLAHVAAQTLPSQELLAAELRCLQTEGLIRLDADSLPTLTPRGRLLQIANGECATPPKWQQ
jgi:hypothetical protein